MWVGEKVGADLGRSRNVSVMSCAVCWEGREASVSACRWRRYHNQVVVVRKSSSGVEGQGQGREWDKDRGSKKGVAGRRQL